MLSWVINVIKWPFGLVRENVSETLDEIRDPSLKKDRLYIMMSVISILPVIIAIGVFAVAVISFIINSGYGIQIDLVKEDFFGSLENIWTTGTSGFFYNKWLCLAVAILYLIICATAVIEVYKELGGKLKAILTILLVLFNVSFGVFYIDVEGIFNVKRLFLEKFGWSEELSMNVMTGLFIVSVILAIFCTILLSFYRPLISGLINILCYYLLAPLCCLLLENIFGMVIALIAFGLIFIFGSCFAVGAGEGGASPSTASSSSKQREKDMKRIRTLEEKNAGRERAIQGYNKHELSYFHVDPKETEKAIEKDRQEIRRLRNIYGE